MGGQRCQASLCIAGRVPLGAATEPAILPTRLGEDYKLIQDPEQHICSLLRGPCTCNRAAAVIRPVCGTTSPRDSPTSHWRRHGNQPLHLASIGLQNGRWRWWRRPRQAVSFQKEALPLSSREQLAPPAVVVRNEDPKLPVEPTVCGRDRWISGGTTTGSDVEIQTNSR